MPPQLLILADDLTGAADTAVQFSKSGIPAAVLIPREFETYSVPDDVAVVAIDTESRHIAPQLAYDRIYYLVKKSVAAGVKRFYKKIDSTFRGNVGAELDALVAAAGIDRCGIALVPAFPEAGRTVEGGVLKVDGKPLAKSLYAFDHFDPAMVSYIPDIIKKQTLLPVTRFAVEDLGSSGAAFKETAGISLFDSVTREDLEKIGMFLFEQSGLSVVAGSAGFALQLPHHLDFEKHDLPVINAFDRILIVNGSMNQVSVDQVACARKAGLPCVDFADDFFADDRPPDEQVISRIVDHVVSSRCCIITTPSMFVAGKCADRLALIAARVADRVAPVAVGIFGGDTSRAVCRAFGYEHFIAVRELSSGMTMCLPATGGARQVFIFKSGGFGPGTVVAQMIDTILSR